MYAELVSVALPEEAKFIYLNIYIVRVCSVLSPGEEVLQLLHTCIPFNLEELKKQESQLPQEDSE